MKNTINPFLITDVKSLTDLMVKLMDTDYSIEIISENVKKYTSKIDKKEIYYTVNNIRMEVLEYQNFLEKKKLNEKLNKKLLPRKRQKNIKI